MAGKKGKKKEEEEEEEKHMLKQPFLHDFVRERLMRQLFPSSFSHFHFPTSETR